MVVAVTATENGSDTVVIMLKAFQYRRNHARIHIHIHIRTCTIWNMEHTGHIDVKAYARFQDGQIIAKFVTTIWYQIFAMLYWCHSAVDIDGVCIMCGKWTNGWQSGFSSIWTAFTWDIEKNSWCVISRTMKFCSAVHHTKPNMWDEHDCEKHIKEQNTQKIIYKSSSSFYYLGFQVDSHQIIWFYWCWSLYCSNARAHTHTQNGWCHVTMDSKE